MEPREEDGGLRSRKLWFAAGTSLLAVLSALVVPEAALAQVLMALLTVCGMYIGGNAATKFITGRTSVQRAGVEAASLAADAGKAAKKAK